MKSLPVRGLLAFMALGLGSPAFGDTGKRSADLSEYVYLHLTRNASGPPPSAAHEYMCRGKPRLLRSYYDFPKRAFASSRQLDFASPAKVSHFSFATA